MKKNIFKKLSFVMALAMIVTTLAPATGAFAATAPKLNATKKYLHLDKDGANEFDFNIKNKQAGWSYDWTSANAKVASVDDANGVATAEGVGTTTVKVVIKDKNNEKVKTLSATVVVRDNISTVKVSNLPTDSKLAVGEEFNFNRSFVTVSGSTTKTSSITRWTLEPTTGATIAANGTFVATVPGEYTVKATAFQSKAKYASWLADSTTYAAYALATDSVKITVVASMVAVKQVDLDTFAVTFDSAITDAATKLAVSQVIAGTKVNTVIKAVTMSADNKTATVDVYVPFTAEYTYSVDYTGMAAVTFVAATRKVTDVTAVKITTATVQMGVATDVAVALYNKDGVNLNSPVDTALEARLVYTNSNAASYLGGKSLSMYTVGATTTVGVTYHTYNYDTTTGTEIGNLTDSAVVTCVALSTANLGAVNAYTVAATADWKNLKHNVAVGDSSLTLFVQLKGFESDGTTVKYTSNNSGDATGVYQATGWKFTSSNTGAVIVGETSGTVYPVAEGSSTVVVSYNDVIVGTAIVTVTGARKVATVALDSQSFVLSNASFGDTKTVSLTINDQLGDTFAGFTAACVPNNNVVVGPTVTPVGLKQFSFNATGIAAGTYAYTVTVTDSATLAKFVKYITVTVQVPTVQATPSYYRIEASTNAADMKITSDDASYTEDVTLSLYGYSSNNVKLTKESLIAAPFGIKVLKPDGTDITADTLKVTAAGTYTLHLVTLTGSSIVKGDKGTYVVNALSGSAVINSTYVTVTDTQAAPVLTVNKTFSTKTSILAAVNDCFGITLRGDTKTVLAIATSQYSGDNGKSVFIKEVTITEQFFGKDLTYTVVVNRTIDYAR